MDEDQDIVRRGDDRGQLSLGEAALAGRRDRRDGAARRPADIAAIDRGHGTGQAARILRQRLVAEVRQPGAGALLAIGREEDAGHGAAPLWLAVTTTATW